jgi:hypothetical protein
MLRLWQELQEMNPDLDNLGSKKSFLPNSTIALFLADAAGTGWMGSPATAQDAWVKTTISAAASVPSFMVIPLRDVRKHRNKLKLCGATGNAR